MWKQHSGNRRNFNVNNLNAKGGYWNYKNEKFYHKNEKYETSVGIGTSEPFSKLSFGNFDNLKFQGIGGNHVIAFNEDSVGNKGVGIGYWYNPGRLQRENEKHGIKFIVGENDDNLKINDESSNIKLYITNNSRFFFNKKPTEFSQNNATVDINGSLNLSETITIGNWNQNIEANIGTIKYDKEKGINGLLIKTGSNNWSKIKVDPTEIDTSLWKPTRESNIYYDKKIFIGFDNTNAETNENTNSFLSVLGNVMIGTNTSVNNPYNFGSSGEEKGVLIVSKNISINPPVKTNQTIYSNTILLDLYVNNLDKNILKAGNNLSFSGGHHSCLLGSDSSVNNSDYTFSLVNESIITNLNYSLTIGENHAFNNSFEKFYNLTIGARNTIFGSKNLVFGEDNTSRVDYVQIFGFENMVNVENNEIHSIVGTENKIIDSNKINKGLSSGKIIGNNNRISTNITDYPNITCDAKIIGDSNCCDISFNKTQESIIIGNNNKILDTTYVLGDLNINENKDNLDDLNNNTLPKFIIGNNIDNRFPYSHAGFMEYNRLDIKKVSLVERKKQPPLLLSVGEANNLKQFDNNSGSFSVDVSGNVRCTNLIMSKPTTGSLRCNSIDTKKILLNGLEVEGLNYYILTLQVDLNPRAIEDLFYLPSIKIPFAGVLTKVISTLKLPNINYEITSSPPTNDINFSVSTIYGTPLTSKQIVDVEHEFVRPPIDPASNTGARYVNWQIATVQRGGTAPISIPSFNLTKEYDTNIFVDGKIQIGMVNKQLGWGSTVNTFTTLTFIISKKKNETDKTNDQYFTINTPAITTPNAPFRPPLTPIAVNVPTTAPTPPSLPPPVSGNQRQSLTPEQINIINQAELNPTAFNNPTISTGVESIIGYINAPYVRIQVNIPDAILNSPTPANPTNTYPEPDLMYFEIELNKTFNEFNKITVDNDLQSGPLRANVDAMEFGLAIESDWTNKIINDLNKTNIFGATNSISDKIPSQSSKFRLYFDKAGNVIANHNVDIKMIGLNDTNGVEIDIKLYTYYKATETTPIYDIPVIRYKSTFNPSTI